jgi:Ulp1 protease family, C-terminal catalytic domain
VHISNFGFVTPAAILFLPKIFETKRFVENLRGMLEWIQKDVYKLNEAVAFATWLQDILLNEPGIMQRKFHLSSNVVVGINSVSFLAHERFVDDDSVRGILSLFAERYGKNGRYLFIPPLVLEVWRTSIHKACAEWEWERKAMKDGKVEKVFAILALGQHWGAICVDLTKRTIQFGDSLNQHFPSDALRAIKRWLELSGKDITTGKWNFSYDKLDVPQQPLTSGSCAINAANAIERMLNLTIERWTHERSAYHRTRFLKLLTGYSKVRLAPESLD